MTADLLLDFYARITASSWQTPRSASISSP